MAVTDLAGPIGSLIGNLFAQSNVGSAIDAGTQNVNLLTAYGATQVAPYNAAGMNTISPIAQDLFSPSPASSSIGQGRIGAANPVDFENFAKNYNMSEGAQYLQRTAMAAQDNSAAARGGLLSGANLRTGADISEGIASKDLIEQYKAMAAGQQQDFTQQQTAYQNLYGQEQLGMQAGIAEAGTFAQGARALGTLSGTAATAAATLGQGASGALGNIFNAIGGLFK